MKHDIRAARVDNSLWLPTHGRQFEAPSPGGEGVHASLSATLNADLDAARLVYTSGAGVARLYGHAAFAVNCS